MMEYKQLMKELYPSDEEEGPTMEEDDKSQEDKEDKEEEEEEKKEEEEIFEDDDKRMGGTEQTPEATGVNNSDIESVAMNVDVVKDKEDKSMSSTVQS